MPVLWSIVILNYTYNEIENFLNFVELGFVCSINILNIFLNEIENLLNYEKKTIFI